MSSIVKSHNAKSRYDLARDYIVEGTPIDDTSIIKMAEDASIVYPILVENLRHKNRLKKIQKIANCGQRAAERLILDTERIYGRVRERSRAGRKAIMLDIAYETLEKARKDKDWKAAERLISTISKMEGFTEQGDVLVNVYAQLELPELVITDNPDVIGGDEIEEVQFEDL